MAQKLDQKEVANVEEIAHSNVLQIETMLGVLVKKGIMTKEEFIEEMQELKREMAKKGTVE